MAQLKETTIDGGLTVNGDIIASNFYPVGCVFTTSTNTNPSELLGFGTWSLIDKSFTPLSSSSTNLRTLNSTNTSSASVYISRANHSIKFRISVTNKVALADTTLQLLTINFENCGLSSLNHTVTYATGGSDGGEGVVLASLAYDTGVFSSYDVIPVADGNNIPAGETTYWNFTVVVTSGCMLDSACNQFMWKRTA